MKKQSTKKTSESGLREYVDNVKKEIGPNKMSYNECLELSRNYHFMLLAVVEKEGLGKNQGAVEKTFRKYEQMINHLFNGKVMKEELELLNSLPPYTDFNKEEGYKIYQKYKLITHDEILA